MNVFLTRSPILEDEPPLRASLEEGGVVTFEGVVRRHAHDGTEVEKLSYEAYEPVALHDMEQIVVEAQERFAPARAAVIHRIGDVPPGAIAVRVRAVAPHRDAAFAAARYVIDEVKSRAAIWKRET